MSLALTVEQVCGVIAEWDPMDFPWNTWSEDQTRYAIIVPVIRALGWNTADPKECLIEYFMRNAQGDVGWADYALFLERDVRAIVEGKVPPIVLIEAKALRTPLDSHVGQLS